MIDIRSSKPTNTRPCAFAIALQEDNVFADFDIDDVGRLYLVRISYDGLGCCRIDHADKISRINVSDSKLLIEAINQNSFEQTAVQSIVLEYLNTNVEYLWKDALAEHNLL